MLSHSLGIRRHVRMPDPFNRDPHSLNRSLLSTWPSIYCEVITILVISNFPVFVIAIRLFCPQFQFSRVGYLSEASRFFAVPPNLILFRKISFFSGRNYSVSHIFRRFGKKLICFSVMLKFTFDGWTKTTRTIFAAQVGTFYTVPAPREWSHQM